MGDNSDSFKSYCTALSIASFFPINNSFLILLSNLISISPPSTIT